MLSEDEVTFHIRSIVEAGDNPAKEDQAVKSFGTLKNLLDDWKAEAFLNEEMPHEIYRIERLFAWMDGKEVSFREDPWIVVSLIIANYENSSSGTIDHMPNIWGIQLVNEWRGTQGSEPAWLFELDRVLMQYVYAPTLIEFEYSEEAIATFRKLSPTQRAQEIGEQLYFI